MAAGRCAGEPSEAGGVDEEAAALALAAPFIKKLFTSTFGLLPVTGEEAETGVPGLEGDLLRVGLEGMPFVAGIEPKDLTLDASDDTGGTEAGLDDSGADGSAIDPNDNPAAENKGCQ